jgi:hypothetical protein
MPCNLSLNHACPLWVEGHGRRRDNARLKTPFQCKTGRVWSSMAQQQNVGGGARGAESAGRSPPYRVEPGAFVTRTTLDRACLEYRARYPPKYLGVETTGGLTPRRARRGRSGAGVAAAAPRACHCARTGEAGGGGAQGRTPSTLHTALTRRSRSHHEAISLASRGDLARITRRSRSHHEAISLASRGDLARITRRSRSHRTWWGPSCGP